MPASRLCCSLGFSLIELLVCLSLMGVLSGIATPFWTQIHARLQIESAREQLISDLQTARTLALHQHESLLVSRRTGCDWISKTATDWGCGWQISRKTDGQLLRVHHQLSALRIAYSKSDPLEISSQGDLGQIGDRWVFKPVSSLLNMANVVCVNSASRVRWQFGESCS